jgi:predicted dehydrogenase/threonine dehydrogenase-like Zn-dependent dehydrogenase
MKQVLQNLRSGTVKVEEVPSPALRGPGVLVATACSLISPGTERATVELGRSSLLGKALRRPDQVRKVLESIRRDGLLHTWHKVEQRLDVTRPLGYSCSGVVLESHECTHVRPGDRVACVGTDSATHAEVNFVPRNLCVPVPEKVSFEEASFAALGAIALHAVRLGGSAIGENVAVVGLGPLGLLLAQILRAAGCRVAGFDLREERLKLAGALGIERTGIADTVSPQETLRTANLPAGFDGVYIAAAAPGAEPVHWAVAAARDRGRIVVVGDVRTDFPRNDCYAKELSIVYARSYGPGRYDPAYEERGVDYPRAYVPWTAGRNLEAFLDLVAAGRVAVAPLVSHRFPIARAEQAYNVVTGSEPSLGVVLTYPVAERKPEPVIELRKPAPRRAGTVGIGFIGAGSYATSYLLPLLKSRPDARLVTVATARGATARMVADRFGFARCATDASAVLSDPEIDAVCIATRHDSHAELAVATIRAGKAVLVEKPLCLSEEELDRIQAAWQAAPVPVMVGYNRRYAPATRALAEFFARPLQPRTVPRQVEPLTMQYTVHAGPLPAGHWLHDPAQGGRIRGEVCHFVDWCCHLAGAPAQKVFATARGAAPDEDLHAVLHFADGSVATLVYDTSAHASLPKETIHVSAAGRTATLENFSQLTLLDGRGRRTRAFRGKGQSEMLGEFLRAVAEAPAAAETWASSARATLKLVESAASGLPVWLDAEA